MLLRLAALVIAIGAWATPAMADPVPRSPEVAKLYESTPVIELVTMGIGSLIWERHGHIALCVTQKGVMYSLRHLDPVEDRCYNYGIGDFHEPVKMAWGFFRGANSFWVGRMVPEEMLQIYVQFDRTIWVQPLPLDADQKQKVIDKLESDIKPANRYYAYDHFADNCTTRIRDIIDNVTGGALRSMTDQTDGKTFRDLARDGFIGMKSMSRFSLLITDIAMGRSTDRVPSYWERMFLPQYLREAVATKWKIAPMPIFVRSECRNQSAQNCIERGVDVPDDGPSGRVLFALVIIALTAPVWLTRLWGRFQRTGLAIAVIPYVFLGTILTFLAAISPLPYVRMNESCLVLLPIDLAVLFLGGERKIKYARGRVIMLGLILALHIVGVFHQPLVAPLLWPLIPMAVVGFWPAAKKK